MSEAKTKEPLRARALLGRAVASSAPPDPSPPNPPWWTYLDPGRCARFVEWFCEAMGLWMRKTIRRGKRRNETRMIARFTGSSAGPIAVLAMASAFASPALAKGQPVVGIAGIELAAQNIERRGRGNQALAEGFRVMLETAVVKSRKMKVFERARMDALLTEQALGKVGLTGRKGPLGRLTEVDYLVYGTITKFGARKSGFQFKNTGVFGGTLGRAFGSGVSDRSVTVHMAVDLKITDVSSGEIVVADSVESSVEHGKGFSVGGISSSEASADPYADVQRVVAAKIAEVIVTSRIPIKVVTVQKSGAIILNYGNVFLSKGDVLAVFDVGERIIDPDTNEVLGAEETLRGSIRVTSAQKKFSKAAFAAGPFPVSRGDIVRRHAPASDQEPERERAGALWETEQGHHGD